MKSSLTIIICLILALSTGIAQSSSAELTAEEIFEKVIRYYDPNGVWDQYAGSMHLYSIFENGMGEEDLTINNASDLYQSTRIRNDSILVFGMKGGKIFFSIDGQMMSAEEVPERFRQAPYNLTEHQVKMLKEHHGFHFSPPLTLKGSGATPLPEVEQDNIFSRDCLAIKFSGLPDNYAGGGYNGAITLYIDPADDYKLHAMHLDNGWYKDGKGILNLYSGEIEINGLKIPARRLYFHAADTRYYFVDAFAPNTSSND